MILLNIDIPPWILANPVQAFLALIPIIAVLAIVPIIRKLGNKTEET